MSTFVRAGQPANLPAIDANSTLASLATAYAGATRVLHRHRLDFCCHGDVSVAEACRKRGIDAAALLAELRAELQPVAADAAWDARPIPELIEHILRRYHDAHRAELPRLVAMAEKVEQVHADKPDCPVGLAAHLRYLSGELDLHMQKEERILFPMILAGHGAEAGGPIAVMEQEHDEHGRNLARLRELAHGCVPPAGACNTWRALYLGVDELEREVMQHIHLENHVLFPRAAGS